MTRNANRQIPAQPVRTTNCNRLCCSQLLTLRTKRIFSTSIHKTIINNSSYLPAVLSLPLPTGRSRQHPSFHRSYKFKWKISQVLLLIHWVSQTHILKTVLHDRCSYRNTVIHTNNIITVLQNSRRFFL